MDSMTMNGIEYRLFNHRYAVSQQGEVVRVATQTPIPLRVSTTGYCRASFWVHRMVATCWVPGQTAEANEVHHINENKTDNRAENLEWISHKTHLGVRHNFLGRYERTEETRQKLRDYRTGRKTSDETKAKQREASLRLGNRPPARPIGFKVSAEVVASQSENHWRNTSCEVDGIAYRSFAEAGRALGIKSLTLRKRCLSPGFPSYRIAE